MRELSAHHKAHYGQPIPSPTCGKDKAARADRCPTCGKHYPQVRRGAPCPFCNPSAAKDADTGPKKGRAKPKG